MSIKNLLQVSPAQLHNIRASYERSGHEMEEDIKKMKDWLKKQPHLPQKLDDELLEKFLQLNKCSLERTKQKIDMYFAVPHFMPELFNEREPLNPRVQKLHKLVVYVPLPQLTDKYERVSVMRLLNDGTIDFEPSDLFKMIFMIADMRIMFDYCLQDHLILDMENVKFSHVTKISITFLRNMMTLVQKSYSDRIGGIHYLNAPPIAATLMNSMKTILKEKIATRMFLHNDLNSLHQYIPKKILPLDYEGEERPLSELQDEWKKFLETQNSWFLDKNKRMSNEKLRPGKPMESDMLGFQGSFRQLSID